MRAWEILEEETLKNPYVKTYPPDTKEYFNLCLKISNFIHSNMGVPEEEFEKVLRQAEEMVSPFDPDKTYYNRRLRSYLIDNATKLYYKEHPETTSIIN